MVLREAAAVSGPGWYCGGERWERYEHAAVPGSSEPSGQSQKSSLTRENGMVTEGLDIQVKTSEPAPL